MLAESKSMANFTIIKRSVINGNFYKYHGCRTILIQVAFFSSELASVCDALPKEKAFLKIAKKKRKTIKLDKKVNVKMIKRIGMRRRSKHSWIRSAKLATTLRN